MQYLATEIGKKKHELDNANRETRNSNMKRQANVDEFTVPNKTVKTRTGQQNVQSQNQAPARVIVILHWPTAMTKMIWNTTTQRTKKIRLLIRRT
ncbi:hypothetical protein WA026_021328 [Henosepilachna vigintioctopunctata]|uniref:Uncharacterized protein n=1 Tax=Henosepilachna vigintioctopunctata TaxID=420089 RepID=A0AAW1UCI8_9CUCU